MLRTPTIQHLIIERLFREMVELQNIDDPNSAGFVNYYDVFNGFSIKLITKSAVRASSSAEDPAQLPRVYLESGASAIAEARTAGRYYSHYSVDIDVLITGETPEKALARVNNYYEHHPQASPNVVNAVADTQTLATWQLTSDTIAEDGSVQEAAKTIERILSDKSSDPILDNLSRAHAYNVIRFLQIKTISDVIADVENAFKSIAITIDATKIDKLVDNSGAIGSYFTNTEGDALEKSEFLALTVNQRDKSSNIRHLTVTLGFLCSRATVGKL